MKNHILFACCLSLGGKAYGGCDPKEKVNGWGEAKSTINAVSLPSFSRVLSVKSGQDPLNEQFTVLHEVEKGRFMVVEPKDGCLVGKKFFVTVMAIEEGRSLSILTPFEETLQALSKSIKNNEIDPKDGFVELFSQQLDIAGMTVKSSTLRTHKSPPQIMEVMGKTLVKDGFRQVRENSLAEDQFQSKGNQQVWYKNNSATRIALQEVSKNLWEVSIHESRTRSN